MKRDGACRWYLNCNNDAEWLIPHPILGSVPACERCRKLSDVPAEKCEPVKPIIEAPKEPPKPAPKVGDLLKCSWGYDQTNVEWLEVVAVRGGMVKLRELESEIVSGPGISPMAGYSKPVLGVPRADGGLWREELAKWKRAQVSRACEPGAYYVKLKSYAYAHLSDGKPAYCSWYA